MALYANKKRPEFADLQNYILHPLYKSFWRAGWDNLLRIVPKSAEVISNLVFLTIKYLLTVSKG